MTPFNLPSKIFFLPFSSSHLFTVLAASSNHRTLPCVISSFQGVVSFPGVTVTVTKADQVTQNGSYGDATDLGFPQPIDQLPQLCAVTVAVTNTSDLPSKPKSAYNLGLFLPVQYNGRFLAIGSASFAGGINWQGSEHISSLDHFPGLEAEFLLTRAPSSERGPTLWIRYHFNR